jgi:hypothetical protein
MGFPTWLMRIDGSSRGTPVFEILHSGLFRAPHAPEMREVRFRSPASPLSLAASVDLGLVIGFHANAKRGTLEHEGR